VPKIIPAPRDHLPRSFFGVPKKIYDRMLSKYGYFFDEDFDYYFEDDDLHRRMEELFVGVYYNPSIEIHHLDGGGLTCKQFGEQEGFLKSQEKFNKKWNSLKQL
jgi:GT2 family glycosyltransferase